MLKPHAPSRLTPPPGWIFLLFALAFLAPSTAGHAGTLDALHAPDLGTPETGSAHAATAPPRSLVGADHLLALPGALHGEGRVHLAVLAQLETQGLFPAGTIDTAVARAAAPHPPLVVHRQPHAACDLDDDGVEDAVLNDLYLPGAPSHDDAESTVRGVSGATGETLWKRDNDNVAGLTVTSFVDYKRKGASFPGDGGNLAVFPDVNDDGVCDFATFGYEYKERVRAPVFGEPSIILFTIHLRVLSGADGSDLWHETFTSADARATVPLAGTPGSVVIRDFPTGFLAYGTDSGPKVVLKTTDVYYAQGQDSLGITGEEILPQDRSLLKEAFYFESVHASDHVQLRDGATGALLWQRDLDFAPDGRFTNLTWLSGAVDLAGDAEPEILLDALTLANPRTSEANDPASGDTLFRYGRGMRLMALRGEAGGAGETLWATTLLDPLAAEPNLPVEESFEHIVWTHARPMEDVTGDGVPDVAAAYVAEEERMATTTSGTFRTHFMPVDGSTGEPLWDVRMQGWGFIDEMGVNARGVPHIAFGILDVPTPPPEGGRFPPKFVRMGAFDARDGTTLWSYEKQFTQNSHLSYHMALGQFETTLAPHDWNGDGLKDLITPSQYVPPAGRDQVLLATASHTHSVLSGADGALMQTLPVWGSDGRVIHCPGAEDKVTLVSGHPRRLDLTRFDVQTGETLWRRPVHNDPAPRAATSTIDVLGLGVACHERAGGFTQIGLNVHAFSYLRGHEVVAVTGALDATGEPLWLEPAIRGNPRTDMLFEPYAAREQAIPLAVKVRLAAMGAFLGALAGVLTLLAWRRIRARGRPAGALASGIILLLLGAGVLTPPATPLATADATFGDVVPPTAPGEPFKLLPHPSPALESADRIQPPVPGPGVPGSEAQAPEHVGPPIEIDSSPRSQAPVSPGGDAGLVAQGAYERLIAGLHDLGDDWAPAQHVRLIRAYFRDLGFHAPDPAAGEAAGGPFEEGADLSYTHDVGDVDGDGVDDLAFDTYCLAPDACTQRYDPVGSPVKWMTEDLCYLPHRLSVVGGRDGRVLWEENLDVPTIVYGCGAAFVMGVVPLAGRAPGLLVYRYQATYLSGTNTHERLEHEIYLLDAATGGRLWTFEEKGLYAWDVLASQEAVNLVINPILQIPPRGGVRIQPAGTKPALFLQGVGYATAAATTFVPPRGFTGPVALVDAYQPVEWAARIEPETGETVWRGDTFLPTPETNVLPKAWDVPPFGYTGMTRFVISYNWEHRACCFDVTGDGVPDLTYKVLEWAPFPNANVNGPHFLSSRLVVIDGDSGDRVIDRYLSEDVDVPARGSPRDRSTVMHGSIPQPGYDAFIESIGDVTGDAAADVLQHEVFYDFEFRHVVTARNGRNGDALWTLESPRAVRTFTIGDADDDGGNDLLLVDWYAWEHPRTLHDDLDVPERIPIRLLSGRDGSVIWTVHTVMAPSDFVHLFTAMQVNGLMDLDRDGVGDVVVDAPRSLDDHTVIHHAKVLSGRTARPIAAFDAVGAFMLPSRVGDITGDGHDEFAVLSGDVNDMWLTAYDGHVYQALWSRRVLSLSAFGYAQAFPDVQYHTLARQDAGTADLLMNLHLRALRPSHINYLYVLQDDDVVRSEFPLVMSTEPQILRLDGRNGRAAWALPGLKDHAELAVVPGVTPGLVAYNALVAKYEDPVLTFAGGALPKAVPGIGAFTLAYGVVVGVGGFALMRPRKPREQDDEEVPELDF